MRWILKQLALNAVKMLAMFAGIYFLAAWGCDRWVENYNANADDPAYARAVFDPILPIAQVLASREYHLIDEDWPNWNCTYAVIELDAGAPDLPPSRILSDDGFDVGWRVRFGGDWKQTPKPKLAETTRDAIGDCARFFSENLNQHLKRAVDQEGSWYVLESVGETVFIYSKVENIAARIRFGD